MRLQPHLSNIVGVFSVVCLCESALFFSEMAIKLKLYNFIYYAYQVQHPIQKQY